jgi:electron transfer flavoprotein-quinone oxidoreductase
LGAARQQLNRCHVSALIPQFERGSRRPALTVIEAKQKNDFSASVLRAYQDKIDASFVGQDLRTYAKAPAFLERTPRMFRDYPEMVADLMTDLFVVDGSPARPVRKKLIPAAKKLGYLNLAKDGLGAVGAL